MPIDRAVHLRLIAFTALAGYCASIITLLVHEVLGHGAAALATGGRFHDFFVTPMEGSANAPAGDVQYIVTAAGSAVALLFGLLVWRWLHVGMRREPGMSLPLVILLWCIANEAILDSIAYMTLQPAFGRTIGLEFGDWLRLSQQWNLPPVALLGAGLLVAMPLCAHLMRDAHAIVAPLRPERDIRPLFAYWALVLPGTVLLLAYLAAFSPWRTSSPLMALGSILGVPLLSLPGAAWLRWRRGTRIDASSPRPYRFTARGIAAGSAAMIAFALIIAWTFGPINELRRGVMVGPPDPDDFMYAAQRLTLDLDVHYRTGPQLHVQSRPLVDTGSAFTRRRTAALALTGPSIAGAAQLTEFIALWNLDDVAVTSVTTPVRHNDGWRWTAMLAALPDSFMVRLWPITAIHESSITRLHVAGTRMHVAGARYAPVTAARFTWRRPDGMEGIDSFHVRIDTASMPDAGQ